MLTLKELKKIVKVADVEKRIPSVKSLKEHKVVVKEMINADTTISVYDHGYVLYTAGNQSTVFPLHSCDDYEYVSVTGDNKEFNKEFFDNENWYIRLLMEAEDRMAYSQSKISTNHGVFSNSDVRRSNSKNRKYSQSITAYVKEKAMSQKWFIAFLGVMDYFNFSFSAFKSSRLSPCSPAVLSTQRFKESMAKEISSSFLLI